MMSDYVWVAVAAMMAAFVAILGVCMAGVWVYWSEYRDGR